MPKIDDYTIQRVLDATDIVDVIGEFVTLKKKGPRYIGLCPFHDDHHATNFVVYPQSRCYRCFACEAKGDVVKFLMNYNNMSFADAIRWLGKKYNIDVDNVPVNWTPPPPRPAPPPLPPLVLKRELVKQTMDERTYAYNFLMWLWKLPWNAQQRERFMNVLWEYCVGGWKDGRVVFWQIDADGVPRAAKLMAYKEDGHRDKSQHPGWIYNQEELRDEYKPDEHTILKPLFGGHLAKKYPQAEVHIVESEKTAVFCAIYFGEPENHLWMATAGKGNLRRDLLQPLIDKKRVIALHPDKDAVEDWDARRKEIDYPFAYVNNSILTLQWKEQDGPKADIADVLERVMDEQRRDKTVKKLSDIMPQIEPAARMLVEKFDLTEENNE